MASALTWLDVSAEQQRRVREIIRLFEEPGTRDELGIGPIRDSFSDQLFPGTSVIQTRARYFLFVPWLFQSAAAGGRRGQALLDRVDRNERQLIERFRSAGITDGLIGRQAGARVKTLPSVIYWGGLTRWGVLSASMTPKAVAEASQSRISEEDELAHRSVGAWHPTLPPAPPGFPNADSGGFTLRPVEAQWLFERIEERVPGTLLAHLVAADRLGESDAPWLEPAALAAPEPIKTLLDQARRFSLLMHGAALLYNLLAAQRYEAQGFTRVEDPVEWYRAALDDWAQRYRDGIREDWDWLSFWDLVRAGNPRIPPGAKTFIEEWQEGIEQCGGPEHVPTDEPLRNLVRARVSRLRGPRAVLANDRLLATWGGSSGSSALVYRWGTVRKLVIDIQDGLTDAGS